MAALTTVAAAVGVASTVGTTAASFYQARQQKKLQKEADAKAAEMMKEARKKLEINFYDQLGIQKEPYELEREALIAAGAQAIQAGVESERGAAATAGRVQMAQQQGQREIAAAMGQEMLGLEKLSAQEDSRLRDIGIQLDLNEVEGAQQASARAYEARQQALKQGIQGIQNLSGQLLDEETGLVPLYQKSKSTKAFNALQKEGGMGLQNDLALLGQTNSDFDFLSKAKIGEMNPNQFNDYMTQLDPNTINNINSSLRDFRQRERTPIDINPFSIAPQTIQPSYNYGDYYPKQRNNFYIPRKVSISTE